METKLTTLKNGFTLGQSVVADIQSNTGSSYYFFYGNHDPMITDPQNILETDTTTIKDTFFNMIAGKRVRSADIKSVIRRIPYVSSTVYSMYDDTMELADEDFFVVTNEGSYFHVYKCLDNNGGAPSTIQPTFSHITGANTIVYQTSDGYRWKYMYSVSSADDTKFSTVDYFPIVSNTTVSNSAQGKQVDIVMVESGGQNYNNYILGSFTTSNIRVGGDPLLYEIANTNVSLSNDFYNSCILYISSGTGVGQYATIDTYFSNSTGKYIILDEALYIAPQNGSEYEIYPQVKIRGTGTDTVNAVARALVNAYAQNSVYRVEILNSGSGYDYITSANVLAHNTVSVTLPAVLRGINSPPDGHGKDAAKELLSNTIIISMSVANTENETIPATNVFKQIGLLKNPRFANVNIEMTEDAGDFVSGEIVYKINPVRVATNATILVTSNTIDCNSADFANQFVEGDFVYLVSDDDAYHQLGQISSVTNSSQIALTTNGIFSCTNILVYRTDLLNSATVTSANSSHVLVSNVTTSTGILAPGDVLIGNTSGAKTKISTISVSDITKSMNTFVQMYKYSGVLLFGNFTDNETVYQANATISQNSSALVHSTNVELDYTMTMFTTAQTEEFRVGGSNTIAGNTSGARMRVDSKHPPELVYGSGDMIFLENISAVTRNSNTTETFQLLISY